jgi:hypothetical protein
MTSTVVIPIEHFHKLRSAPVNLSGRKGVNGRQRYKLMAVVPMGGKPHPEEFTEIERPANTPKQIDLF